MVLRRGILETDSLHKAVCAQAHPQQSQVDESSFPNCQPENSQLSTQDGSRRAVKPGQVIVNGTRFCSISEAACGLVLERYIEGFKVISGHTYQVPVNEQNSIDFMVQGVFIEHHHLRFYREGRHFGDFPSPDDFFNYQREWKRAKYSSHRQQKVYSQTKSKLEQFYYQKRRALIDRNPNLRRTELIVVTSIEELHQRVLKRFLSQHCPDQDSFINFYKQEIRILSKRKKD